MVLSCCFVLKGEPVLHPTYQPSHTTLTHTPPSIQHNTKRRRRPPSSTPWPSWWSGRRSAWGRGSRWPSRRWRRIRRCLRRRVVCEMCTGVRASLCGDVCVPGPSRHHHNLTPSPPPPLTHPNTPFLSLTHTGSQALPRGPFGPLRPHPPLRAPQVRAIPRIKMIKSACYEAILLSTGSHAMLCTRHATHTHTHVQTRTHCG